MKKVIVDGNSACAHIAYLMNDLAIIYPITPSSSMSEICDTKSSANEKNIFGNPVKITQMQSEAGVAGALHGALSTGSLTTTFTSSQGLLLMLPNMYKIAGELLPCVFYVASRSLATHALNIFCDHSDIYSCLKTGFNIISCSSVQEVNDMAIACNLSALKSKTPFICFFDGFRTSHELNTIEQSTLEEIKSIVDFDDISSFKSNAMANFNPYAKGTNQNPDVFFQNRVGALKHYADISTIVKNSFKKVESITNRQYDTIEYYGDEKAHDVVVSMGSSADVLRLVSKGKTGVLKIRLLKPFDEKTFIEKLPKTVRNITVLERNLDVNGVDSLTSIIASCLFKNKIKCELYSGVYGLGGKEFTPDMAIATFNNMKDEKKTFFTVGINDDENHTNLKVNEIYNDSSDFACRIYGYGSDGSVSSAKSIIKILGEKKDNFAQGYFDYDSRKSGSLTISHIRTSKSAINKPFNCAQVDISVCNNSTFLTKYDMTNSLKNNGIFLINCAYSQEEINEIISDRMKEDIVNKNLNVYFINASKIAAENNLKMKINTIMETALFKVYSKFPFNSIVEKIKKSIVENYSKKGDEVVKSNINAIMSVSGNIKKLDNSKLTLKTQTEVIKEESEYFNSIISPINNQKGNDIPVSHFSADGKMPTNTSKLEKRGIATSLPEWIPENCIQCGRCSLMCPHACIRAIEIDENEKIENGFKTAKVFNSNNKFHLQFNPLDCTGCGVCSEVCPVKNKAIKMNPSQEYRDEEIKNYHINKDHKNIFKSETNTTKTLQYKLPYFEFSSACAGCGETPYIKLVSQLFGDRMIIANATGCSSIYGATYPICPYVKDEDGFGPSWANSLFEDNAEFGYGMAISKKLERENFVNLIKSHKNKYSPFVKEIVHSFLSDIDNHSKNKEIVSKLYFYKHTHPIEMKDKEVFDNIMQFIKPSIWIIGGDGWAYDIGFGGLDHVVASGENVNILILDSEVYSNTGGQTSKATPRGASAKFNVSGKTTRKKDILGMLMTYENVYCAQVSMGANPDQCVKAFEEAEKFDGPSIILAYSPCINHGYDMKHSQTHCLNSVKSGYNTLFRYNSKNEEKMQIDSYEPIMEYNEFVCSENRFNVLSKTNPENKEALIEKGKIDSINKREKLKSLKDKG